MYAKFNHNKHITDIGQIVDKTQFLRLEVSCVKLLKQYIFEFVIYKSCNTVILYRHTVLQKI